MSFFEPVSPPPFEEQQPTERVWAPPRWDRPSEGTMPTVVGVSQPFARSDNVAFVLDHLRVYPNGFQLLLVAMTNPRLPDQFQMGGGFASFSLIAAASTPTPDTERTPPVPPSPPRPPLRRGMLDMAPRVGIRFSDGRSAGAEPQSIFDVAKDQDGVPTEPVIVSGGYSGGGGRFRFEHWVFPLPTPGPLEVFAEWTVAGIQESSVVISGDDVREAAQHAIVLWS
jgi:hypothetical protein